MIVDLHERKGKGAPARCASANVRSRAEGARLPLSTVTDCSMITWGLEGTQAPRARSARQSPELRD